MKALPIVSLIVALIAIGLVLTQSTPASPKLGYVRSALLLEQATIASEVRETLQAEKAEIDQNIQKLREELAANHQNFLKEQADLSLDDRKKRLESLAEEEGKLNRYANEAMRGLTAKEREAMEPVFKIINARIAKFAEKNGYTLIWGTLNEGNILYGDDASDITEQLIAHVNEEK